MSLAKAYVTGAIAHSLELGGGTGTPGTSTTCTGRRESAITENGRLSTGRTEILGRIVQVLNEVRARTPLTQAITNYITINDCANILICFGVSPAMCEAAAEVEEFAGAACSLYINLGTLTEEQRRASVLAARYEGGGGIPGR